MSKFPVDAPLRKVLGALENLGFQLVREGNHISNGTRKSGWFKDSFDHA